jgi:hypothetical protein
LSYILKIVRFETNYPQKLWISWGLTNLEGNGLKALSELLNVRAAEVRVLLHGQLPEERTAELKQQILKTGIPL